MKCDRKSLLLYAVTDRSWVGEKTLYEQAELALKGGVTALQLREKGMPEADFLAEAIEIRKLCTKYNVPLFINDNVKVALECGADGVHVGLDDMGVAEVRRIAGEKLMIGASAHNVEEALLAEKSGADYLGSGAVFGSTTKTNVNTLPHETLKAICASVRIPVVAIGGITEENILQLAGTGICGSAVISAIFGAEDIENACRKLKELSEEVVKGNLLKNFLAKNQI